MIEFLPCGDTAVSVQFGENIDRRLCLDVLRLKMSLEKAAISGVLESVPSYRSLLVHYDPLQTCQQELREKITVLAENPQELSLRPRRWKIPLCFDTEFAWDLPEVAEKVGKNQSEVVASCLQTELFIYMIGFSFGLLYLGDFPLFNTLLRRENPRTRLEKGAVAVAQGMAVIYPFVSPGGWNVIANTPVSLFDIGLLPPSPFSPGDYLCFHEVDRTEYRQIALAVEKGEYQLSGERVEDA